MGKLMTADGNVSQDTLDWVNEQIGGSKRQRDLLRGEILNLETEQKRLTESDFDLVAVR